MLSPNKIDPTRTITLRRSFKVEINRAFNELKKEILKLIVDEDALGLKPDRSILYNQTYDYSSTQIDITDAKVLAYVKQLQSILLPEDIVRLDKETHITIRYGLYDGPTTLDGVKALVSEYGEIEAKIVGLSIFEIEDADVLKYDVESWQLKELNDRLKLLPNKQTYEYHPHMTIAYLKKGTAQAYVDKTPIDGMLVKSDSLTYSNPSGGKVSISLSQRMTGNKRWRYKNQDDAVKEFEKWVDGKVDSVLLSQAQANKWRKYIARGFEKGAARAFDDTSKSRKEDPKLLQRSAGFVEGRREQFIRQTMGQSIAAEKLKLLESRALADVKGMCDDLKNKSRRILTDGLVGNLSPREIASNLMKQLDLSKQRALAIAYTELVRAHAEGQLESMRTLGVEKVGVAIEWSTAKGACKLCEPLKGIVLTIGEARGMIPRHPFCRCAFTIANVGETKEEKKGQLRSKTKIEKAIRASERQDSSDSDWGPAKDIAKDRPKSTLNVEDCGCEHLNVFAKLLERIEKQ